MHKLSKEELSKKEKSKNNVKIILTCNQRYDNIKLTDGNNFHHLGAQAKQKSFKTKGLNVMKKNAVMSRTGKVFCLILIFSMVLSVMTIGASASNWEDTREDFAGPINGEYTQFREKQDSSSCYINNDRSNCALSVLTYGARSEDGDLKRDLSYSYSDGSVGGNYSYVQPGQRKYMPSLIYEYGYEYAGLRVSANDPYDYNYYADFLWSPDSIGG